MWIKRKSSCRCAKDIASDNKLSNRMRARKNAVKKKTVKITKSNYYFLLKSRLSLENFSGKTAESIRQDFFSAVLLANLESLLSAPVQEKLQSASENTEYKEQVNRANSYHALKFLLLDLLYRNVPALAVIEQLQKWFEDNPVRTIRERKVPRTTPSFNRSDHFQRRVKKTVF